jgi:hypothetical protein
MKSSDSWRSWHTRITVWKCLRLIRCGRDLSLVTPLCYGSLVPQARESSLRRFVKKHARSQPKASDDLGIGTAAGGSGCSSPCSASNTRLRRFRRRPLKVDSERISKCPVGALWGT